MRTARTGLNLSHADWNKSVECLVEMLDRFKVPEKEKSQVLRTIFGLKADIVGRGSPKSVRAGTQVRPLSRMAMSM